MSNTTSDNYRDALVGLANSLLDDAQAHLITAKEEENKAAGNVVIVAIERARAETKAGMARSILDALKVVDGAEQPTIITVAQGQEMVAEAEAEGSVETLAPATEGEGTVEQVLPPTLEEVAEAGPETGADVTMVPNPTEIAKETEGKKEGSN